MHLQYGLIARVGDGVVVLVADVSGKVADRRPTHRAGCAAVTAAALLPVAAELFAATEVLAVLSTTSTAATASAVMSATIPAPTTATAVAATP
jgi:hypothetical protein